MSASTASQWPMSGPERACRRRGAAGSSVVEARLINTGTDPSLLADDSIRLVADGLVAADDQPDMIVEAVEAVEAVEGESVTFLQPGLPTALASLWEVPPDAAPPDGVIVGVLERYRLADDLIVDDAYGPLTAVARVLVDLDTRDPA